jgi:assimilatory nitrate reductase catalytic subunit
VKEALKACELVILSDCYRNTSTSTYADIQLPAATWGEKDGTVTNSERRISRQRSFLPLPGEAKPDWWIVCEVARRMGFKEGFNYSSPYEIFKEHALLSGFENYGQRDFDISGLSELNREAYNQLEPVQWPFPRGEKRGKDRVFENGVFFTPNQRAQFIPVIPYPPKTPVDEAFPLVLNTGRIRDQWHTMTRTGKISSLSRHRKEPFVTIHPLDAHRFGVVDGKLAQLTTSWGKAAFRVEVSEHQPPGSIFAPIHWNDQFSSGGNVGQLVNPWTDPISGQPECKHTPVAIKPIQFGYHGFCLTHNPLNFPKTGYWSMSKEDHCFSYLFAMDSPQQGNWTNWASSLTRFGWDHLIEFRDQGMRTYRVSVIQEDRLELCIYLSASETGKASHWLKALFEVNKLDSKNRRALLYGRSSDRISDPGPIVCTCFAVGKNLISEMVSKKSIETLEEIGSLLRAGTNCGSCLPELKELLRKEKEAVSKKNWKPPSK